MKREIAITGGRMSAEELSSALGHYVSSECLQMKRKKPIPGEGHRDLDPSLLYAMVSAAGTALGALVAGLLRVAQEAKMRKIIIQGTRGLRIEVPADLSQEKLDEVIERLKTLENDIQRITLD